MVGIAATTFPITVFSASLPEVAEELNTSQSIIAWVLAAPLLAMAIANPVAGKFGDYRGHRFSYIFGLGMAVIFSFLTALAWDAASLIAFRTIGQATGAFTGPATVAILLTTFPTNLHSRALGYWGTVTAIAPAIGVAVGGPLIDAFSWRWVFIIEGFIALAAFIFAVVVIPETKRKPKTPVDWLGAILLISGVMALMIGINRGTEWGFLHIVSLASLILAPILLAAFVAQEKRVLEPFLQLDWFKQSNFTSPVLVSFFINTSYLGAFATTPFLLERIFDYESITTRSLVLLVRPLMFALGAALGGLSDTRLGSRKIILAGSAMVAISAVYMGLAGSFEIVVLLIAGLMFSGFGHGVVRPSLITTLGNSVREQDIGLATGAFNTIGLIGASIGTNVMLSLIGDSSDPNRFLFVYLMAFGIGAAATVSGVWLRAQK